nr:glutamate receptor 3.3 isoform X1 [Tanacetum cinerariifolium]
LIAHALEAFFSQGGVVSFSNDSRLTAAGLADLHLDAMSVFDGGKLLLDNIWKTDFVGLSGHIKFNSDRNLVNHAYDIINVIGTGFRTVGYWSNGSGLTTLTPESIQVNQTRGNPILHNVIWPREMELIFSQDYNYSQDYSMGHGSGHGSAHGLAPVQDDEDDSQVEEVSPVKPKKTSRRASRAKKDELNEPPKDWTMAEETALCQAWCDVSENNID